MMTLNGHEGPVNSVSWSSDNRLLASASTDGTVRIWDMRTSEEMITPLLSGDGAVWSVAFYPNCNNVVSGTASGTVCVWSLVHAHIAAQRLRGHSGTVSSVSVSPNGYCVASASLESTVRLWDAETNQQFAVLKGQIGKVVSLAFSPDSVTLVTGSEDHTIQLWDIATGKPRYELPYNQGAPINGICFLVDGQKIAAGCGEDIIHCKTQTGNKTTSLHSGSSPVLSVNASTDGQSLVSVYGNGVCLTTLPRFRVKTSTVVLDGHSETVRAATFSLNGLYIASASDDWTVRIWNANGKLQTFPVAPYDSKALEVASKLIMSDSRELIGHKDAVTSIDVSPDGEFIISGSIDMSVRVWNARPGTTATILLLLGHTDSVNCVAISSDGLLIASGSHDKTIRLWDRQTGEAIGQPIQGHSDQVNAVVFSADARWLASGSEGQTARVWNITADHESTAEPLHCNSKVQSVKFSPDGRIIGVGTRDGCIRFWHCNTGWPVFSPIQAPFQVYTIGFSPDGTHIVAGGAWADVVGPTAPPGIWKISTGTQVLALRGHGDDLYSAAYSPSGLLVVTGSADQTVRIWNATTGAPNLAVLRGHDGAVLSVAFAPDGRSIFFRLQGQ